ncbi:hypothetical protein F5148DRAFT_1235274 [Russula earlei]|uniref:Uncharacterized protein n=1 Tax=Russula earlei TaxID=71964 RepID=A0ACC0TZV6_9AGAM|nr:hypothetical protein F5148DRAFT_1235274 [Russula earlei]
MARRVVSWVKNEPDVSPVPSSATASTLSIVSFDSTFSDLPMATPEAHGAKHSELGVKDMSATNLQKGASSTEDPFLRHDKYYFKDGNITFLVEGTLYCVHRYFFSRDSTYFSTKLAQLDVIDHEPLRTIVSLSEVESKDFEAFLSVIYPEDFDEHSLSYEQWKSVLHLSTRWGFASLRRLAVRSIKPPTACDKLLLARTYGVDHWVIPALSALCERKTPISLKEGRMMSIDDVVLVSTIREEIRTRPRSTPVIPSRIEAAQARMLANVASDDVPTDSSESEASEMEPSREPVTSFTIRTNGYEDTNKVAEGAAVKTDNKDESDKHVVSPTL